MRPEILLCNQFPGDVDATGLWDHICNGKGTEKRKRKTFDPYVRL